MSRIVNLSIESNSFKRNFKQEMLTTKKVFSMSKFRRVKSPDTADTEFGGWSQKYLKLKTFAASLSSRMSFIRKKPFKNEYFSSARPPNEETDLVLGTEIFKLKNVKSKKYLRNEEAAAYNNYL